MASKDGRQTMSQLFHTKIENYSFRFIFLAHLIVSVLSFQPSVHMTEKQEFLCPGMLDFQS